jgi:APA family basic amino acid/polyamine antiporter
VRVIILCGLLIATIAGLVPLGDLAELTNIGTLAAFVFVCIAVIMMRAREPGLLRPFKCPWHPVIPILGIIFCGTLMAFLPLITWQRFGVWLLIGVAVYFTYSMHNSRLAKATP